MQSTISRRAVLAGAPAVAAVAAMPAIPALAAVEHEPILALWADYQRVKAEGLVIAGEYLAAERKLPMKWQPRGEGSVVAPAFMSDADQADRKAAFKRVGLDEIGQRLDANTDIVCDAEQRVLTTMPVTPAGAAIVAKALTHAIEAEAGFGWADETAIENLALWLERQAGGVA